MKYLMFMAFLGLSLPCCRQATTAEDPRTEQQKQQDEHKVRKLFELGDGTGCSVYGFHVWNVGDRLILSCPSGSSISK